MRLPRSSTHGLSALSDSHWDLTAACRSDPEAMWAHPNSLLLIEEARNICRSCDHVTVCIQDAIDKREWDGVRGGFTGPERQKYHRQRLAIADYPLPVPPVAEVIRFCLRCPEGFVVDPAHPYSKVCTSCRLPGERVPKRCEDCGRERRIHAKRRCEPCYKRGREKARKRVAEASAVSS